MRHVLLAASLLLGATPAVAQGGPSGGADGGQALKAACKIDYARRCSGNDPAAPIAASCLAQYYINLSPPCRAALDAYRSAGTDAAGG